MEIKDLPTTVLVATKEKYIDILRRGKDGYNDLKDWNSSYCSICKHLDVNCYICPLVKDRWCDQGSGIRSRLNPIYNDNWESDVQAFIGLISKEIKSREFVSIMIGNEIFKVHKTRVAAIKKLVLEEIAKK